MRIPMLLAFAAAAFITISSWNLPALAGLQESPYESTPVLDIGKAAVIMKDGSLRVPVEVTCGMHWEATDAYIYVEQNGYKSEHGTIPITCGSNRATRYDVIVPAIPGGFQVGQAQATAVAHLTNADTDQTTTLNDTSTLVVRMPKGTAID